MSGLAWVVALALGQAPLLQGKGLENPIVSRQKEKGELIEKLRRDIFKVDRSINETL